jgi:heme-degrading monooxygenase HmoA
VIEVLVRMWEAKAAPDRFAEAAEYARNTMLPAARDAEGNLGAEAYASVEQGRVVVITHWLAEHADGWTEPDPPAGLWARPPHAWTFTPL